MIDRVHVERQISATKKVQGVESQKPQEKTPIQVGFIQEGRAKLAVGLQYLRSVFSQGKSGTDIGDEKVIEALDAFAKAESSVDQAVSTQKDELIQQAICDRQAALSDLKRVVSSSDSHSEEENDSNG